MPTTVLLADDKELTRKSIQLLLSSNPVDCNVFLERPRDAGARSESWSGHCAG
jgi:hypothetical protein